MMGEVRTCGDVGSRYLRKAVGSSLTRALVAVTSRRPPDPLLAIAEFLEHEADQQVYSMQLVSLKI